MLSIFGGEFVACPLGHMYVRVIMLLNQSTVNQSPHVLLQSFKGGTGCSYSPAVQIWCIGTRIMETHHYPCDKVHPVIDLHLISFKYLFTCL